MEFLDLFCSICGIIITVAYLYQFAYILIVLLKKDKKHKQPVPHRIAVLISARNEEEVLPHLIESIKSQTYPHELIDTFIVADNCNDNTASAAREAGAIVFERFNTKQVGKGFALDYLMGKIKENYSWESYDAFLVLDADNILDIHFVAEMNKTFSDGYKILTSYRNSKNYGDNWISAGYSLWFLREARFLNHARKKAGVSCVVTGTGFMFAREIADNAGGWPYHLLSEDTEFTCDHVIKGEKIGIAVDAMLYDEQPTEWKQSFRQRLRWVKGSLQVFRKYGKDLAKGAVKGSFSCYDMIISVLPLIFISVFTLIVSGGRFIFTLIDGYHIFQSFNAFFGSLFGLYQSMFLIGMITTIYEWDRIHTTTWKKIFYTFTFPLYMATYIPIGIAALFMKVEWKPIKHKAKTLGDIVDPK